MHFFVVERDPLIAKARPATQRVREGDVKIEEMCARGCVDGVM